MGCQHSASKRDEELGTMSHDTYVTHHSQQSRNSRNSYCSVTSLTGPPMLSPKSGAPIQGEVLSQGFRRVQRSSK